MALLLKRLPNTVGDIRSTDTIPGLGKSPGGGNGNTLEYSCLGNPKERRAWRATVPGIARVRHGLVTKLPHHHRTLIILLKKISLLFLKIFSFDVTIFYGFVTVLFLYYVLFF